MNKTVLDYVGQIQPINWEIYRKAQEYNDALVKPPGSLGKLEDMAAQLCGIFGSMKPKIDQRCVIVAGADNGVVAEGVSCAPQRVTLEQTLNIPRYITGVGSIAKAFHTDVIMADLGVDADIQSPYVKNCKVRKSTGNIVREPAMTYQQAQQAILTGIELAEDAVQNGYTLLGVGEMGIGNTTTSSAVLAALLELPEEEIAAVVGKGGGLGEEGFRRKINVIQTALKLHQPKKDDVIDVLSKVGGLDIAAMAGVYLGAAYCRVPVVIDGFISVVAALCAMRICPAAREYMFASHQSFERGYVLALSQLELSPCLQLNMRLGEGSGCPLMFGILDGALAMYYHMATFEEAKIDDNYLTDIRALGEDAFSGGAEHDV